MRFWILLVVRNTFEKLFSCLGRSELELLKSNDRFEGTVNWQLHVGVGVNKTNWPMARNPVSDGLGPTHTQHSLPGSPCVSIEFYCNFLVYRQLEMISFHV